MHKISKAALVAALCLAPGVAFAETVKSDDIVVTATRTPTPIRDVAVSTTILTAEDLAAAQTVNVADTLSRTSGVTFNRNGGPGSTTQINIRGAETDQTLVLIDGVRVNDPSATGNGYNFGNLLAGDIDQIEILRGPQSTLWGSQAIGGVVSILTQKPGDGLSGSVSAEGGSFNTGFVRAALGSGGDWGGVRLSASHYETSGFSQADENDGNREDDGFRNTAVGGRLDLNLSNSVALDLRTSYSDSRVENDGFLNVPPYTFSDTPEYSKTKTWTGYSGLRIGSEASALQQRIGLSYAQTDRDNFNPDADVLKQFDARGTDSRLEYQGDWRIAEGWRAIFGAETDRSWFRSHAAPSFFTPNPPFNHHAVTQDSLYGQLQVNPVEGLTLTAGLRYNDHEKFGENNTAQAGAAYAFNQGRSIFRANYGEGFKAPSLFQLYSEFGATSLKPEEAEAWDIGFEQHFGDVLTASITYFNRDTSNQIDFRNCIGAECLTRADGLYDNIASTHSNGVELAASAAFGALTLSGNYTWLDTENRSEGANRGNDLARRPNKTAAFEATYVWPLQLSTTLAVQYIGASFDNASNTVKNDSYTLIDLRASYPLNDTVELYGRIENITDNNYETISTYGTAGRAGYAGVRVRFQ